MRISKLSESAGLPVGTVKFYLRSGLLHAGRATSATQAQYDDSHLARLRLIRALLEVGGLALADIQRVLDAIDLPTDDTARSVALVHSALVPGDDCDADLATSREAVSGLGWSIDPESTALIPLARALEALASVGVEVPPERLRVYADSAFHAARADLHAVEEVAAEDKAVVAGTAPLVDALIISLRRLAAEHQLAQSAQQPAVPVPRLTFPGA
ncbi:MerR family transcriptional regulator [Nocardioides donggukensis]|uniref:MerR family transcriptional regulator n=1 Tax=Nocardioides donggukensis TaxID=2774019 RepID=A0A927PZE4_9ACTN|nr:MerR family transcriptional regulator [Nocardioides donggukensis]MBD8868980.1 MerR family transcriptional regulator [Nocardioides donggukensis]